MGIPYVYEPERFAVNGSTCLPDLLLPFCFVEVKGYCTAESQRKMDEFGNRHPLVVVDANLYQAIEQTIAKYIPNWEFA